VDFGRVETWVAIVLASRELAVTGLRVVAAREGIDLTPETTGKAKMAAQVVAILFLILDEAVPASLNFHSWGTIILLASLVLSVVSALQYVRQFVLQMLPRGGSGTGGP
jgi:CDP-diacylglycerol--glycerol-3-phosphate 3-phosphatidyltransferase